MVSKASMSLESPLAWIATGSTLARGRAETQPIVIATTRNIAGSRQKDNKDDIYRKGTAI
jgi:hypothetical protein